MPISWKDRQQLCMTTITICPVLLGTPSTRRPHPRLPAISTEIWGSTPPFEHSCYCGSAATTVSYSYDFGSDGRMGDTLSLWERKITACACIPSLTFEGRNQACLKDHVDCLNVSFPSRWGFPAYASPSSGATLCTSNCLRGGVPCLRRRVGKSCGWLCTLPAARHSAMRNRDHRATEL